MRTPALAFGLLLLTAAGCATPPAVEQAEKPELGPELKSLVLDELPSDLPNPVYLDFAGKAELIGFALEPAGLAPPGSKLALKSFWRSTGKLDQSYELYTELVTPAGKRFAVEGAGPVRKGALKPGNWEPGKIYIDELDASVPEDLDAARFSLVVGLKTAPIAPEEQEKAEADAKADKKPEKANAGSFGVVYLPVLSGLSDDKHGGVIATLQTGVTPGAKRARSAKDEKRGAGAALRRPGMPPGKLPSSALKQRPTPQPAQ